MKIAVTGASGFIGSELVKTLSATHQLIALQRKLNNNNLPNIEERYFDLTDKTTYNFTDADALVHCAFIPFSKQNKNASTQNIEATLALAQICIEKGIHFIFLSSMSAHADALSEYGKHKYSIEKQLNNPAFTIIRPGLVIGNTGGLFNNIKGIIAKSSVIPLIDGGKQPIQTVLVSELNKAIQHIAEQKITGIYNIATTQVYTLKQLYIAIAAGQKKQVKFIGLPYGFMKFALTIAEGIGLNLPIKTESLLGLKQLRAFKTKDNLDKLNIKLMSLEEAIKNL
jgi:nucleoside-diphosphate-sugar epimerase